MSRISIGALLLVALALTTAGAPRADVVMDWNNLASVTSDADQAAQPGPSDAWAPKFEAQEIVAVAIFQAVNTASPRYTPFRAALTPAPANASSAAAAVAAAHAALVTMFPDRKASLDDAFMLSLGEIPDTPARAAGIDIGERAAAEVIGWRGADNAATPTPFRPAVVPGSWEPTMPTTIPPYVVVGKPSLLTSPAAAPGEPRESSLGARLQRVQGPGSPQQHRPLRGMDPLGDLLFTLARHISH